MELTKWKEKGMSFLKKYKYAALIILIGILLMIIPGKSDKTTLSPQISTQPPAQQYDTALLLDDILSQIDGAGKVKVLLTIAAGEETVYQTDSDISVSDDSSSSQTKTVLITTADKAEAGVIRQVIPPIYMGAIVVCEGADRPAVQLAIVDAVAAVTGLGADRISILKMK